MAEDGKILNDQMAFLYKVLDDNQTLIRFIDAKTAFVVALVSAMLGKVLADLGSYFPRGTEPLWRQVLVLSFFATVCVAASIIARILFPSSNPVSNSRLMPHAGPRFYISEMRPRRIGRIFSSDAKYSQLAEDHDEYVQALVAADQATLLKVVAGEVLKISYIRQIKIDRFTYLVRVIAVSVVLFIFLLAADATTKRIERPHPVQIQGPIQVDIPPQKFVLQAPSQIPDRTPNSKLRAPDKKKRD